jgi:hypothetical protein
VDHRLRPIAPRAQNRALRPTLKAVGDPGVTFVLLCA